eukprot:CAMPEP_0182437260 /NCGR_PEP_ID=MMETSP1167-20130531/84922_1 /TAXON_ID=2988 /ORGANISM="Mallomonas Sp, Strain CCMP3275" /LENGTH=310 /DNA_ID=CAMNT_0024630107 /DNA_START=249 /DNA_END=1181 /DNA_ORIENTATION=-
MASAYPTLQSGKIYRAGCVSNASESDISILHQSLGMKSWVDLRSDKEHEEDEYLNSQVYKGFQTHHYDTDSHSFLITEISSDTSSLSPSLSPSLSSSLSPSLSASADTGVVGKRFFVSLMSEKLIQKGIFSRLRKRNKLKVFLWAPLAAFSRRAYARMKRVFIREINDGGLPVLNQFVVKYSGYQIAAVLKVAAQEENLPVALFCTAGKDRTGLIAMLILDICGVPDHLIVTDYEHSDSAYRDINNKRAMVASLSQSDLNPDTFLRAKGYVISATLAHIRDTFGSVNNFLDKYGFDEEWRKKLRKIMIKK